MTSPVLTLSSTSSLLTKAKPGDIPYVRLQQPPLNRADLHLTPSECEFLHSSISQDDAEVRRRIEDVQKRYECEHSLYALQ